MLKVILVVLDIFGIVSSYVYFLGLHAAEEKFGDLLNVNEAIHENDGTKTNIQ